MITTQGNKIFKDGKPIILNILNIGVASQYGGLDQLARWGNNFPTVKLQLIQEYWNWIKSIGFNSVQMGINYDFWIENRVWNETGKNYRQMISETIDLCYNADLQFIFSLTRRTGTTGFPFSVMDANIGLTHNLWLNFWDISTTERFAYSDDNGAHWVVGTIS